MDIAELEAFVAIARLGGFTRAAEALNLSQPAISRRIGLLEHRVGAPLFERIRGRIRLTVAGETLMPFAETALAALRDGREAVRALAEEDSGPVAMALVGTLAGAVFSERLRRFRTEHAGVTVQLRTANSRDVSALVRRGDVVLGLRYFTDSDPDIVSRRIGEETLRVVSAPQHRLAGRRLRDAGALAGETWLTFPTRADTVDEDYARALRRMLDGVGIDRPAMMPVDSLTAQKRLIEAGFGLGFLPDSSIEEELRAGSLRVLPVPGMQAGVPITLIHRRRAYLSRAARSLIAALAGDGRPAAKERAGNRPAAR